ncbi:RidA family protein [Streptomyces sp. NPDC088258]|uniref:RidA family protein n=1 Tax=Streptomyces sp. NPDC088258 TaxID=3365849 RepID=UPI00382F3EC6
MSTPKTVLVPPSHSKPIGRYSPGLCLSLTPGTQLVFFSGQVATDDRGTVMSPGDAGPQARAVFQRIAHVLAEAGGTLADLVAVTIHLTDIARDFPAVSAVRDEVLAVPPPASVLVEVSALAEKGCVVEISGIAAIGGST